jgi:hypothetical protein
MLNKKILLISLCLFFYSFLKCQTNSLVLFSNIGQVFSLTVNGEVINKTQQSNVKVFDLGFGWQILKAETFINNQKKILIDSFYINNKYIDKEFTFVINKDFSKLNYNSIEEPSGPKLPNIPAAPKEEVSLVDNSIYGILYQAKNNAPVFFNNYHSDRSFCYNPLTEKEIKYALNLLNKCNDDEMKLIYLLQILENNCYTSSQFFQLISVLDLEMDLLNTSKKGYSHLIDKENASILLPLFRYQSIKDSFVSFLKDQQGLENQKKLNCEVAITDEKFDNLLSEIKKKKYENEKTVVAKSQLINSCISTIQAQKILELFFHDREKIEVTKFAYQSIIDKENINNLLAEFQFQESKDEFINYIKELHEK